MPPQRVEKGIFYIGHGSPCPYKMAIYRKSV